MLPYSPLHHLLLADVGEPLVMTSGNVSDEPIAYEDDDACERLGRHRRPVPPPRPADRDAHRRLGRAGRRTARPLVLRRSRGYVPGSLPLPVDCGAAPARLRRRAEEHVRAREGRARVGRPPHRRPEELRDAALVRDRDRALPAPVRGRARGRGARPAPRVPVHEARARSSTACGSMGVQHHHAHLAACLAEHGERGPRGGRDLRRHRIRRRRHGLGRRAAARRPRAASSAWACCSRCGCPAATRRCASRGGWRAPGSPRRCGERPRCRAACASQV